jgi:hypothetical protein
MRSEILIREPYKLINEQLSRIRLTLLKTVHEQKVYDCCLLRDPR